MEGERGIIWGLVGTDVHDVLLDTSTISIIMVGQIGCAVVTPVNQEGAFLQGPVATAVVHARTCGRSSEPRRQIIARVVARKVEVARAHITALDGTIGNRDIVISIVGIDAGNTARATSVAPNHRVGHCVVAARAAIDTCGILRRSIVNHSAIGNVGVTVAINGSCISVVTPLIASC